MNRRLLNRPVRGFTLIEVMITVVIVGILAAVALPSYTASVRKSQRSVAKGVVIQQAQLMERFYTQKGTYTGGPKDDKVSPNDAKGDAIRYDVTTAIADSGLTYTVTATPRGEQAKDPCGTLSMTNTGAQSVSTSATDCW